MVEGDLAWISRAKKFVKLNDGNFMIRSCSGSVSFMHFIEVSVNCSTPWTLLLWQCVHNHARQIYQRAYNSTCVPEKLLILLRSMIRICSLPLEDSTEHSLCKSIPKGMEKQLEFVAPTYDGTCSLDIMRSHLQSIVTINMVTLTFVSLFI